MFTELRHRDFDGFVEGGGSVERFEEAIGQRRELEIACLQVRVFLFEVFDEHQVSSCKLFVVGIDLVGIDLPSEQQELSTVIPSATVGRNVPPPGNQDKRKKSTLSWFPNCELPDSPQDSERPTSSLSFGPALRHQIRRPIEASSQEVKS